MFNKRGKDAETVSEQEEDAGPPTACVVTQSLRAALRRLNLSTWEGALCSAGLLSTADLMHAKQPADLPADIPLCARRKLAHQVGCWELTQSGSGAVGAPRGAPVPAGGEGAGCDARDGTRNA
eukprot:gene40807-37890_t